MIELLLNNDTTLKSICDMSILNMYLEEIKKFKIPKTYYSNDVDISYFDGSVNSFINLILYMAVNNYKYYEYVKDVRNIDNVNIKQIMQNCTNAFEIAKPKYIEYLSGIAGVQITTKCEYFCNKLEKVYLTVSFEEQYKNALFDTFLFIQGCIYVCKELYRSKKLTNKMSEYEKARVIYNWVILHVRYDLNCSKYSYTGYSSLFYEYGVCQGITALFNMLCKLNGINIVGMAGEAKGLLDKKYENHIWSYAILDQKYIYIDVTWGKPILKNNLNIQNSDLFCNFSFFDISRKDLEKEHRWNKEIYG